MRFEIRRALCMHALLSSTHLRASAHSPPARCVSAAVCIPRPAARTSGWSEDSPASRTRRLSNKGQPAVQRGLQAGGVICVEVRLPAGPMMNAFRFPTSILPHQSGSRLAQHVCKTSHGAQRRAHRSQHYRTCISFGIGAYEEGSNSGQPLEAREKSSCLVHAPVWSSPPSERARTTNNKREGSGELSIELMLSAAIL